ncbi:MAG TPA: bifunctional diguanylate cyclase/phosphodiesterase, partial [Pilimelia sp.]|nr:bifunctional diguanylate cyclase/phosphodiesterase [Pilimelia sp.]
GRAVTMVLIGGAVMAACAAVAACLVHSDPAAAPLWALGLVFAFTGAAHATVLPLRVGPVTVAVGWIEAVVVVGLHLLPWGWLVLAVTGGAVAGCWLRTLGGPRGSPVWRPVAATVTATALVGGLVAAVPRPDAAPGWSLLHAGGLLAAGVLLHVAATAVTVADGAGRLGRRAVALTARALRATLPVTVCGTALAVAAVAVARREPQWLVLSPPMVILLHQTYAHRLRAADERRSWQALAEATGRLSGPDEPAVARAGVRGARDVFGARWVELDVVRPYGLRRRYIAGHLSPDPFRAAAVVRLLTVADTEIAQLRIHRDGPPPTAREELMLRAYGDALAAALQHAATHRRLRMAEARSSYAAVHDPLTGLINRSALLAEGDGALRRLPREQPVGLLLLDVNDFHDVNDALGHRAGDELLRLVADRLRALTRPGELVARLGGDEFAMLVAPDPDAPPPTLRVRGSDRERGAPRAATLDRARRIAEQLAVPVEVAGVSLSVEAAVGVVLAPAGTATMSELVRRADRAMHQAKAAGGGIAWYDSARDAASTDQLALLAELREALGADDQLVLALQPAVDLSSGAATGVEALIRWRHPRRGMLAPDEFVPVVEGSDLLAEFTRYVIDRALLTAADWGRHGVHLPISVNISARSLLDPGLPTDVAELLRRHAVPAHRLVLEITETVVMSESEIIDEVLAGLRALGVGLAVDDFGTGFSSLTFLTRIAVDELKVDREFVAGMVDSPEAAAIVRATVQLARQLGLRVVAEGVETADQRAALVELGCTTAQGYHFFRPMPPENVLAVLRSLRDNAQATILPLRDAGAS